ncbi:NAD/NADP octopine/nopaline dehydrogenase family protein [Intestinimonas butyriciproducens]|uniref:NAD/NADP octopine/nopaline dehydrogenase family protein n=1 Tax=Intestinimonas butyriciproducens TaxID=1297617 RepID=UPI0034E61B17
MKKVTVLGGGGTGCTMAADLALRGFDVTLWEDARYWDNLRDIQEVGSVELVGRGTTGTAVIPHLSDDLAAAVDSADVILISMIATRHEELCAALAPLLKEGQTVCFSAGNLGSMILKRMLADKPGVITGEMQGNIFPCRLIGKAKISIAFPYAPKKVAAFPAKDTPALIKGMSGVYECVPAGNVLETTLNSPNTSIHLAGSLLNMGAVEKDPSYKMYAQGITPGVCTCIEAVEKEKAAVMEAMGYPMVFHAGMMRKLLEYEKYPELELFRVVAGPSSMKHRYIEEDATVGQTLLITLARQYGIAVPTMEALVHIASVTNGKDYIAQGKSVAHFGWEGMTPQQINEYLETGVSPK